MTELEEVTAELAALKSAKTKRLLGTATQSVSGDGDSISFATVSIPQMNAEITRLTRRIRALGGRGSGITANPVPR